MEERTARLKRGQRGIPAQPVFQLLTLVKKPLSEHQQETVQPTGRTTRNTKSLFQATEFRGNLLHSDR